MALSQQITLDNTKASFPTAYGRIDDDVMLLSHGITYVYLNWFVNSTVAQTSADPIRADLVSIPFSQVAAGNPTFVQGLQAAITNGSILSPLDALKTALYLLLLQQPSYTGAASV